MNKAKYIQIAALFGALAVGIGAFGAHGLEPILESKGTSDTFETAVKYHFYHTLALLACAFLLELYPSNKKLSAAFWLFAIGIIIFSGTLYTLSLTGVSWLGAITPIGGVAFIAGWVMMMISAKQPKK
ncbi:DUF423 domain-containing protein [Mongoliibacter ruber]|uniref:Uncharacterized membrane protein YgdD (TMEM256/DUF423 family) n=1 Tax=Mongoliibacter ruber TaxID=1750599 RepID=A0A2T0WMW7_9BACT|nr:DUF423 domain-containing protein [Mongoliibacter ruber]PRY88058.1 uncharacterized membrane protein YgdD (TMEM256/DUF423 family) [Mongoliibacter ruber]